jgi:hypothetical protein
MYILLHNWELLPQNLDCDAPNSVQLVLSTNRPPPTWMERVIKLSTMVAVVGFNCGDILVCVERWVSVTYKYTNGQRVGAVVHYAVLLWAALLKYRKGSF